MRDLLDRETQNVWAAKAGHPFAVSICSVFA